MPELLTLNLAGSGVGLASQWLREVVLLDGEWQFGPWAAGKSLYRRTGQGPKERATLCKTQVIRCKTMGKARLRLQQRQELRCPSAPGHQGRRVFYRERQLSF